MGKRDLSRCFLWIPGCRSIHTCFMRGPIDIAFLDSEGNVVGQHESLGPWRVRIARRPADSVIELPAGFLRSHDIELGDRIVWQSD